jgi:NAD(P)-dependent dehydrogenase (short-subunit alcohol dehydrogenase family)
VRQYGRIDVLFNDAPMTHFNWLEDITNEGDLRGLIDPAFFSPARRGRISGPAMRATHA